MKNNPILTIVSKIMIPFIMIFAFYIQIHGEESPGGGFQAGAIMASALILHSIVFGNATLKSKFNLSMLNKLAAFGSLIYLSTGIVTMALNGKFLEYYILAENNISAQKIGITIIELGVGLTVFAVFMIIYLLFVDEIS